MNAQERLEALGPAERIIQTITRFTDHAVHNRPGVVFDDQRQPWGKRWEQATWVKEGEQKVVYTVKKVGKKQHKTRIGIGEPGSARVIEAGRVVAEFRAPGLFPEVVAHLYSQIADVWRIDNEFAAKWASYAFEHEENRDLKVLLAAFLLVQNRYGEPIKDGDATLLDDDYRAVGEAMCLIRSRKKGGTFNPKLLLRVGEVLELPAVVEINRKLGFGQSARTAPTGRYYKAVEKWLAHHEANIKLLEKVLKEGFRQAVMQLARKVGYKPQAERFFELLRWKQVQAKDGRRGLAIGKEVAAAESWKGLSEKQICERIVVGRLSWKRIVGMLPTDPGLTPAIMAAAIEGGGLSDADLIILTPTLEELGLLQVEQIAKRWKAATEKAENQRAANIARNVKDVAVKEQLEQAADQAAQKAVAEVAKDFRIYVIVDKSGSMQGAIERAKECLARLVSAFPLDRLHVCVFNTEGREVEIKVPSAVGVAQAFRGHNAGGGTSYAAGARCLLERHKPAATEDALLFFVGDEQDSSGLGPGIDYLVRAIQQSGVEPVAFGLLHIDSMGAPGRPDSLIHQAAGRLNVPCFPIDEEIFNDPYAVSRTLRNLITATPVRKVTGPAAPVPTRVSLIEQILKTPLLQKPAWA
jgi:hypothetical protein